MKRFKILACAILGLVLAGITMTAAPVYSYDPEKKVMLVVQRIPKHATLYINQKKILNSFTDDLVAGILLKKGDYKIEAIKPAKRLEGREYYDKENVSITLEKKQQIISLDLNTRIAPSYREKLKAKYKNGYPMPEMVAIPEGSFKIGCVSGKDCLYFEKPVHTHNMPAFEISATEITFEQWDACVADGGCDYYVIDYGWGRGKRPVTDVNWENCQQYIRWLNKKTGKTYRLPTEPEWEYAARAGSTTKYYWGNELGKNRANCKDCGSKWDNKKTAPVKSFQPNAFGLYDMHGNVSEWTQDCYDEKYYRYQQYSSYYKKPRCSRADPKVIRGGSWLEPASTMRSAARGVKDQFESTHFTGFRVVRQP